MKEEIVTFGSMHADHRHWQSEHSAWCDDIDRWREQHESALTQLAALEASVSSHGEALDSHADDIQRIERSLRDHEKGMAAYQHEGAGAELQEAMVKNHRQQAKRQVQQREAHERIKKHHHTVMAQLAMLKAAVEAAM